MEPVEEAEAAEHQGRCGWLYMGGEGSRKPSSGVGGETLTGGRAAKSVIAQDWRV